ncbi:MAG: efflux RND transporter permease subunit [Alphaproteobacteria bacterium]|nr:efflux RND transporter permease subunit [Alphaproteobacteria bacterium]
MVSFLHTLIELPRTVISLIVVMLIGGIISYIGIPKEDSPDIDIPVLYISVTQNGISPKDSERLLIRPLESKLNAIEGLKKVTSIATEGHASIIMEFDIDFDKDVIISEVRAKVDQAKRKLPEAAKNPEIFEVNFNLTPSITIVLSGSLSERGLSQKAQELKEKIESIPSVLEVNIFGNRDEILEATINTMMLDSYKVTLQKLIKTVSSNNLLIPAGSLRTKNGYFDVKVPGLIETTKEAHDLPFKAHDEAVVKLGDIAHVRRTFKDPLVFTHFNGKNAIVIDVIKRGGKNIIENNIQVRKVVTDFTKNWPNTVNVTFTSDKSKSIISILGSLQSSIVTAIILVMIVVIHSLGPRASFLIGISIPCSFLISFLIINMFGMSINMMILFGLVLTVGILVDCATVIVEYADRKMAEGHTKKEAYKLTITNMFSPVMASTATTLAAFLPMLLWPGVPGKFMSYLPIIVIIVLSVSLIISIIFVPVIGNLLNPTTSFYLFIFALLAVIIKLLLSGQTVVALLALFFLSFPLIYLYRNREKISAMFSSFSPDSLEPRIGLILSGKIPFVLREIPGLTGTYLRILAALITRPILTLTASIILMVTIIAVFILIRPPNVQFFVTEEPQQVLLSVFSQGNFSAPFIRKIVERVESEILKTDGIKNSLMKAGHKLNNKEEDLIGLFILDMEDICCRRKAQEILSEIKNRSELAGGIRIEFLKVKKGPPTADKPIVLEISGIRYDDVKEATKRVRKYFNQLEGVWDVEDLLPLPSIEWAINVDREQASRFNTDTSSIGGVIQLVTNGFMIGKYRPADSTDEIEIHARFPLEERSVERLNALRIQTPSGLVPIRNFISREPRQRVSMVRRYDGRIGMRIEADLREGIRVQSKIKEINAWIQKQKWKESITFRFRGSEEDQEESARFLIKAMFGSFFLMFIILLTQFNSFYQTILTLSTVLMSSVGVMLGILLTGQDFSIIMTGTGIIALAGIVVNNAIILIDTYNRIEETDHLSPLEKIMLSAAQRLRPIMITSITTILGLLPMALRINIDFLNRKVFFNDLTSAWWETVSTTIISGLLFSTFLTLLLIPTLLAAPLVIKNWLCVNRTSKNSTCKES